MFEADTDVDSTGGISALRLFGQNTPLEESIKDFKSLCSRAFVPRTLGGIRGLREISAANHGSIYKTTRLDSLLRSLFGEEDTLFVGKTVLESGCLAKVAVTSTKMTARKLHPVLVSNYNRPEDQSTEKCKSSLSRHLPRRCCVVLTSTQVPYDFLHSGDGLKDWKTWEA